jgi:hypothetical protein
MGALPVLLDFFRGRPPPLRPGVETSLGNHLVKFYQKNGKWEDPQAPGLN